MLCENGIVLGLAKWYGYQVGDVWGLERYKIVGKRLPTICTKDRIWKKISKFDYGYEWII